MVLSILEELGNLASYPRLNINRAHLKKSRRVTVRTFQTKQQKNVKDYKMKYFIICYSLYTKTKESERCITEGGAERGIWNNRRSKLN
jgi:hypothetical protein